MTYDSTRFGDLEAEHFDPAPNARTLWLALGGYLCVMAAVILLAIWSVK